MNQILVVSFSLVRGGAAIAANNFTRILANRYPELQIDIITQDNAGKFQLSKRLLSYFLGSLQFDKNPIKHSLNLFSYSPVLRAFKKYGSLFHLHWINNDTLSIFDFDMIPKGTIITLHDEWLYCGSEHCYKTDDLNLDFINGYHFFKHGVGGMHWNYLIWKIKLNKLRKRTDLIYTVPSSWMLKRAKQSLILRGADVRILPNPIDIDKFYRLSGSKIKKFRQSVGVKENEIILAFGAIGGKSSYLKGAHLLDEALYILSKDDVVWNKKVKLINFGGKPQKEVLIHGFKNISLGHISSQSKLALLYSSVDCVVVPSLVESFGQVAAESLACETPVISFNYSGLTDIVLDGQTGLTAKPYSAQNLADKIKTFILLEQVNRDKLGHNGRKHIVKKFSYPIVAEIYKEIIDDAVKLKNISGE